MFNDRTYLRLALIGTLVACLGLAACGRKGPLDPPPGASLSNDTRASEPASPGGLISPIGGETKSENSGLDASGKPQAPPGAKKHIPLDVLLD